MREIDFVVNRYLTGLMRRVNETMNKSNASEIVEDVQSLSDDFGTLASVLYEHFVIRCRDNSKRSGLFHRWATKMYYHSAIALHNLTDYIVNNFYNGVIVRTGENFILRIVNFLRSIWHAWRLVYTDGGNAITKLNNEYGNFITAYRGTKEILDDFSLFYAYAGINDVYDCVNEIHCTHSVSVSDKLLFLGEVRQNMMLFTYCCILGMYILLKLQKLCRNPQTS